MTTHDPRGLPALGACRDIGRGHLVGKAVPADELLALVDAPHLVPPTGA